MDLSRNNKLLDTMLADIESAPPIYQPSNFWSIFIRSLTDEIKEHGISSFRSQKHALGLYVPTYPDTETGKMEALCDYKVFLAGDDDKFPWLDCVSESRIGSPVQQFLFDDKYYSRSMLNYLRGLAFLKKHVDTSGLKNVLEIGGGFGTLGEIFLKSDFNRFFYVNIDIPPLSYISTRYLEEVFGKDNIAGYEITRDLKLINIDEFAQRYKAIVLCPWQLPYVAGEFDLFVNFFSFQEMEPDIVENYASHINRLVKKNILLRNQKDGKQVAKQPGDIGVLNPVSRKDYIRFFNRFKVIAIDSKVFGNRKDGFESEVMILQNRV
ncbi:MAG: putative sugar O-methyltransferase [Desulfamplus sp.]|nr:putative sugar O-methyltransferase [Desulfamplus sp.]